ncbi:MAG: SurA N-terminal domain-containing protein [Sideroxydans sp.]|nr:SurA N-terminal domain-containing protein [Sideroxydans sp.]
MFDFVHEKKRLVQFVLALIILPFAFWGVDSFRNSGGAEPLATVNGEKIGQQEFENALDQQRQRMREMAGANYDPAIFDQPEIKHSVLENLVSRRLLVADARDLRLMPGDEQIAQVLIGIGAFQKDGKFDKQSYISALNSRGMNQIDFERSLSQDIAVQRLTDAYSQNGYAADTVAEMLIRLNEQQRTVSVANLNAEEFMKQAQVSDAEVSAYYSKNAGEFQLPERASVEYVTFSADSLQSTISLTDEEIKKYYEEHVADFGTQEQRQAAHILIGVAKQATDADKQAAKAKAEQVLQQVKQSPGNFAALAKQYSQDPGSATRGGDLGMFGRGAMVKPFEESVFSLKVGEVSGLVQSDFGYHIIKLLAVKPAKVQALNEVRGVVEQRLKSQHASDKFAELAEKFNNTVYEQSDSLKPAAELVNASVQRGVWLSKGQAPTELWSSKVLQAVFSDDVLKNKRNTAAVEVAPNTLLAARVVEYKPASERPLAEVAAGIKLKLQQQQAVELATKQGMAVLAQLQHGDKVSVSWKSVPGITRSQHAGIAPDLSQAIFGASINKLPVYVGVKGSNGYLLARIDSVKEVESIDENKRSRYAQQIRQITGEELLMAYLADKRKRSDITMKDFKAEEKK